MKKIAAVSFCAALLMFGVGSSVAQDPSHATEFRKPTPGNGPDGKPRLAFLAHRLGNDHAEGITALDMNGDGFDDLLSGAYWYENPGALNGILGAVPRKRGQSQVSVLASSGTE